MELGSIVDPVYSHMYKAILAYQTTLVMLFSMALLCVPMVIVVQEKVFVSAVHRESYCRNSKTGEGLLEPIPSTELTFVSPCLTIKTTD